MRHSGTVIVFVYSADMLDILTFSSHGCLKDKRYIANSFIYNQFHVLLGFFDIHCVEKDRKIRSGDPLVESKKLQKNRIVPKKIRVKNTKGDPMFLSWTSVVQVDDVE